MIKANVQAFAAGWTALSIRDAVPTEIDFSEAGISPNDRAAVLLELEHLANQHLAEALRLEAL